MAVNPFGAIQLHDWGAPKIITAYANTGITGGQLVLFESGAGNGNVVSSGADSFTTSDIKIKAGASGTFFGGVALKGGASGAAIPVGVDGVYLLQAIGPVSGGNFVGAGGDDSVIYAVTFDAVIGRARTTANSGGWAVVHIK